MKKLTALFALVMAVMMVFALTACTDNSNTETTTAPPAQAETTAPVDNSTFVITEEGQSGEGGILLDASLFTVDVPEGLLWDAYSYYYSAEDNLATVVIDFGTDYTDDFRLTVTTQRMIDSLDTAEAECIRTFDFVDSANIEKLPEVTYGDFTYKALHVTSDYSDENFLVTYYEKADADYGETYIEVEADVEDMAIDDAMIVSVLNSLKLR